jgi:ribose 5-phosphate isomerase A
LSSQPRTSSDALAEAAIAEIQSGMIVGLGTGRTASRGIFQLAEKIRAEGLDVRCVPTSHASETQARALGLTVVDFATIEDVDYVFDGADEVDPDLCMIKGRGGALVRERVVATASARCVYMITEEKLVERLGERSTLPIAVHYFGLASVRKRLNDMGLSGVVRRNLSNDHFLTDQGNLVIDVTLPRTISPREAKAMLDATPGVVDHGLFLDEADEVVVEMRDGRIERMLRPAEDGPGRSA